MSLLARLVREPLLHFLLIGGVVFGAFAYLNPSTPANSDDSRIEITLQDLQQMVAQFKVTWRRPPTEAELDTLIESKLREHVLVREAEALSMDRGDPVIRQRLSQKMSFLINSAAGAATPSEDDLRTYYEENQEAFATPPKRAFRQVYAGPNVDEQTFQDVLAALKAGADPFTLGSRSLLPVELGLSDENQVDSRFGRGMFDALLQIAPGQWIGPVQSGFGMHAVFVTEEQEESVPPLDTVRAEVLEAVKAEQAQEILRTSRARAQSQIRCSTPGRRQSQGRSAMIWLRWAIAALVLAIGLPEGARAHALEPGYLEIRTMGGDAYRVFWRKPDVSGAPMAIDAKLTGSCTPEVGPPPETDGQAWVSTWVINCPQGLAGNRIEIKGLSGQRNDVLVRFPGPEDAIQTQRLTPTFTSFEVPTAPSAFDVLRSYVPLGIDHILEGLDHLLFVFALVLLISDRWRLVGAITAFTVAHSITMAVATFDLIALPGPPVEAVIALSIMFLASELRHKGGQDLRLSERYPWTVSFSFGLLHGFGFAGALREIGLPPTDVPLALLSFNLGVEIGQLLFVAAVLVAGICLRRIAPALAKQYQPGTILWTVSVYGIGSLSAYWFIDRLSGF